jgi:hypothetical protein
VKLADISGTKRRTLKAKITEHVTNSKNKDIRDLQSGICEIKKSYQSISNTGKDGKGDLVTDCHSILARWRNHFSQLLNVHGVDDARLKHIQQSHWSLTP